MYKVMKCSHICSDSKYSNCAEQTENIIKKISTQQVLTIIPTTNCNARCWYCFEKGMSRYDMSSNIIDETINFVISSFDDCDIKLNWSGGEPLMNIGAIKRITNALNDAGYKLHTSVTTNGSILPHGFLEYIKQSNEEISFGITIDEIFDAYNSIKRISIINNLDPFQNLLKNIHCILDYGIKVSIRINFRDFDRARIISSFLENEFKNHESSLISIYFALVWNPSEDESEALKNALTYIKCIKDGYNVSIFSNPYISNVLIRHFSKKQEVHYCSGMNLKNFVINVDGNVYKCHRLIGDNKYSCGNVKDGINKNSNGFKLFVPRIESQCQKCKMSHICVVNCKANKIMYGQDSICKNTKIIVDGFVKDFFNN